MTSVSFFGATGGCALAALIKTLQAGITATALVRSSEKLKKLLSDRGVSEQTISEHLTIVEGNVRDSASVKKALLVPNQKSGSKNQISDIILSGIGGSPQASKPFSIITPFTLDDPTICADATRIIIESLRELQKEGAAGRPLFAVVSTTGISNSVRDVPLAFVPLYHWMLAVPHKDKRNMEVLLEETAAQAEISPFNGFVSVRPSLLLDGEGVGPDKIRVGWERSENAGNAPAVGYTITRNDVGAWIFENLLKNEQRNDWLGRKVTLTT